ncbi:MAG: DUF1461 domain-containing protein [Psychrobium sp.]|nr:DUF1461 domain-containing protein [Psychrobium sp.]
MKLLTNSLYSLTCLLLAFIMSWLLLSKVDFGYRYFHDMLDIQQVTEKFGGENRYKQGFEHTTKSEHIRLFGAINRAVHQQGTGLTDIVYHHKNGHIIAPLLHQAEIVHLTDVATLIDRLKDLAIGIFILWLLLLSTFYWRRLSLPTMKQQSLSVAGFSVAGVLLAIVVGPTQVFYYLHQVIFPDDHQWFFYYQDSLMSTLMKAPDLFGAIFVVLAGLALVIYVIQHVVINRLYQKSLRSH